MDYYIETNGTLKLKKPLTKTHATYLYEFSCAQRQARDVRKLERVADPVRAAVGLPLGTWGNYCVLGEMAMQKTPSLYESIIHANIPPLDQPSSWCNWIPIDCGREIRLCNLDCSGKPVEWLQYILKHFLTPWGYELNGQLSWQDESSREKSVIKVSNNRIVQPSNAEALLKVATRDTRAMMHQYLEQSVFELLKKLYGTGSLDSSIIDQPQVLYRAAISFREVTKRLLMLNEARDGHSLLEGVLSFDLFR